MPRFTTRTLIPVRYSSQDTTSSLPRPTPKDTQLFDGPDEPISMENPYKKEQQVCILCKYDIEPDFKNVRLLSQFQSTYTGRIYGRHITGLCKTKQERVELEIIKAQKAGLMPTYHKAVEFIKDPKLFNPEKPLRSHKY